MAGSSLSGHGSRANTPRSPVQELPPPPENGTDFSDLPPELLNIIFKKLPDVTDVVQFRSVCHRFRSAAILSDPRPQLPLFVRRSRDYAENTNPEHKLLSLFSMYSGQFHQIKASQSYRKELSGSAYRYMLCFDWEQSKLSLLNPITGREISLPPLDLFWCELVCIRPEPRGVRDLVVIYGAEKRFYQCYLAFCRVGDSFWVTIEQSDAKPCCRTYYNHMFYVHDQETRVTQVIDATTRDVKHLIPPPEYKAQKPIHGEWCIDFFVESCGDLLGISSVYEKGFLDSILNVCFEIHQLDYQNGNPRWVKIDSIGDRFLFLHKSSGVSYNASDFPGFRRNSIYLLASMVQRMNLIMFHTKLIFCDIERSTAEELYCPKDVVAWFLPGLY